MVHQFGRLEMYMHVDAAGRGDQLFAMGDHRGWAADQIGMHAIHDIGIACLANARDPSLAHADIGLHDAQHRVHHERVVNHQIQGSVGVARGCPHAHSVAETLAPARGQFFTMDQMVLFDLGHQAGVAQAHTVAFGRAVGRGISRTGHGCHVTLPENRARARVRVQPP